MMVGPTESLDNYIDRFNSLRRRAVDQLLPNSVLAEKFLLGLHERIAGYVSLSMVNLPLYKQVMDVDVLAGLARSVQNSKVLGNERSNGVTAIPTAPWAPKRATMTMDAFDSIQVQSNRSKLAGNNGCTFFFVPAMAAPPGMCHPINDTAMISRPVKVATVCWTPHHQCNTAQRSLPFVSNSPELQLGAMSWDAVSTPVEKVNNVGFLLFLFPPLQKSRVPFPLPLQQVLNYRQDTTLVCCCCYD
ncbi:hypothetical protein BD770DRAFT_458979 [Pilaira anomala]|nr:hypothetical protein BD770DRAFT_458979 [Pilaira anomala]